jgi:hypothetical protein
MLWLIPTKGEAVEILVIKVPSDLASSLADEGVAEELEPITWKAGPDLVSVLTLAVDATAAVTSLVVSRDSIAEFVKSFVRKLSRKNSSIPELTVTIEVDGASSVLIETNNEEGCRRLTVQIEMAVDAISEKHG